MRPRRACSRSPAASSPPGGGWRSWSSIAWSSATARVAPCRTAEIPLGMAAGAGDLEPPDGLAEGDLPDGYPELLAFRYGHAARRVLAIAGERPELGAPIVEGEPDLLAEAVIAARLEQARSVADVLLRRTRLGLARGARLRTAESVAPVAEAIGAELGLGRRADQVRGRGVAGGRRDRGRRSGEARNLRPHEAFHRYRQRRRGRGDRGLGRPRRRNHEPVPARQGGRRPRRDRPPDLRPGQRAGLGRGRLAGPRRDDRRGPRAARAPRARHRQGAVLQGGARPRRTR